MRISPGTLKYSDKPCTKNGQMNNFKFSIILYELSVCGGGEGGLLPCFTSEIVKRNRFNLQRWHSTVQLKCPLVYKYAGESYVREVLLGFLEIHNSSASEVVYRICFRQNFKNTSITVRQVTTSLYYLRIKAQEIFSPFYVWNYVFWDFPKLLI